MDSGIPISVWRYYLLMNRPESHDSIFSWSGLVSANNSELIGNLGNLVNRIIKFVAHSGKYASVVPNDQVLSTSSVSSSSSSPSSSHSSESEKLINRETALISDVNQMLAEYIQSLEAVKLRS